MKQKRSAKVPSYGFRRITTVLSGPLQPGHVVTMTWLTR